MTVDCIRILVTNYHSLKYGAYVFYYMIELLCIVERLLLTITLCGNDKYVYYRESQTYRLSQSFLTVIAHSHNTMWNKSC